MALKITHISNGVEVYSGTVQKAADDGYVCDCHALLGNDFWFLPKESCLHDHPVCVKRNEFFEQKQPWCTFCKKHHEGGDTCMGHHP